MHLGAALRDAEFEDVTQAQHHITSALATASTRAIQILAALAWARVGRVSESRKIAEHLASKYPSNTLLNSYWLPVIRAAGEQKPAEAIELLRQAAPYELGYFAPREGNLYSAYLRGKSYLLLGQGEEAASEFQKFKDYRGIVGNYPWAAVARLGLARAYTLQGDARKARNAYQEFLTLWKNADADSPILRKATLEYASLD